MEKIGKRNWNLGTLTFDFFRTPYFFALSHFEYSKMALLTASKPRGTKRSQQAAASASRSRSPSPVKKTSAKKSKTTPTPGVSAKKSTAKKSKATPTPKKDASSAKKEMKTTPKSTLKSAPKSATKSASKLSTRKSTPRLTRSTVSAESPQTPSLEEKYGKEMVQFLEGDVNEHSEKDAYLHEEMTKQKQNHALIAGSAAVAAIAAGAAWYFSQGV